jgi:antimicrobial peptide system SdpA family protein
MSSERTTLKVIYYCISQASVLLFVFAVLLFTIPETSVSFSDFRKQFLFRKFVPEGWAFFTREAREKDFEYFLIRNGRLQNSKTFPISSKENFLGIGRKHKLVNSELYNIIKSCDSTFFLSTVGCTITELSKKEMVFHRIPFKTKFVKDSICIVIYDPIPWAWSGLMDQHQNQGKYVFVVSN